MVPYASSHLDWAASELVVPGDHGCQDAPETIRELRRILYLHLGKVAPEAGPPGPRGEENAVREGRGPLRPIRAVSDAIRTPTHGLE